MNCRDLVIYKNDIKVYEDLFDGRVPLEAILTQKDYDNLLRKGYVTVAGKGFSDDCGYFEELIYNAFEELYMLKFAPKTVENFGIYSKQIGTLQAQISEILENYATFSSICTILRGDENDTFRIELIEENELDEE